MSHRSDDSKPKKILYCEGNIDGTIGGSYYSLLFLVAGLDRSRFEPLVVFRSANALIPRYNDCGIRTMVVPSPAPLAFNTPDNDSGRLYRLGFPALRVLQKATNFAKFLPIGAARCGRLLLEEDIDIVHLNNSILRNHEWMIAAVVTGTPCITHERGIHSSYSWLSKFLARRIDGVICVSRAVKESLASGGVQSKTSEVIYNGIDPKEMTSTVSASEIRARHDIPVDAHLIGVIGNIKQWKGQETVIRALPEVLSRHPSTYCILVGDVANEDRPYFDGLRVLSDSLAIADRIIFTGYARDVSDYVNALDVVLHTSLAPEPFGRVLIEAMSMEKPLIGAAAGAVPEIIDDGQTGLTFEPGDASDLARCINRLLDSPASAAQMGAAGFDRLHRHFHISENIARTENYYAQLLGCHSEASSERTARD